MSDADGAIDKRVGDRDVAPSKAPARVYGAADSVDPEFYAFSCNLEARGEGQNMNSAVILKTDSECYGSLKQTCSRTQPLEPKRTR